MEPDGSLPHSQVPATCRYPKRSFYSSVNSWLPPTLRINTFLCNVLSLLISISATVHGSLPHTATGFTMDTHTYFNCNSLPTALDLETSCITCSSLSIYFFTCYTSRRARKIAYNDCSLRRHENTTLWLDGSFITFSKIYPENSSSIKI